MCVPSYWARIEFSLASAASSKTKGAFASCCSGASFSSSLAVAGAGAGAGPGSAPSPTLLRPPLSILIIHRASTARSIVNEGELVQGLRDWWARYRRTAHPSTPVHVDTVQFEALNLADTVALMRRTHVLIGVDGTGLLNAVFMRHPCGALVRLAPYGTATMMPSKGANFDRVARAAAGRAAVWECGDRDACARVVPPGALGVVRQLGAAWAAVETHNASAVSTLSYSDRFLFVTRQSVAVDVGSVVRMVEGLVEGVLDGGLGRRKCGKQ